MLDPISPLIIIGAGRSGSTLLTKILNAHPRIAFRGETSFLLPRLWKEIWYDQFWLNWRRQAELNPTSAQVILPSATHEFLRAEQSRVAKVVAEALMMLLEVPSHFSKDAALWGYKELWNGGSSYAIPWFPYDEVFVKAFWLHLVRHPFAFVRSCAQWNGDELTRGYLVNQLREWVLITKHGQTRASTGRYREITFESVLASPRSALEPLFQDLSLTWDDRCAIPLATPALPSQDRVGTSTQSILLSRTDVALLVEDIEGLSQLMEEFGFDLPNEYAITANSSAFKCGDFPDLRDTGHDLPTELWPHNKLLMQWRSQSQTLESYSHHRGLSENEFHEIVANLEKMELLLHKVDQLDKQISAVPYWIKILAWKTKHWTLHRSIDWVVRSWSRKKADR